MLQKKQKLAQAEGELYMESLPPASFVRTKGSTAGSREGQDFLVSRLLRSRVFLDIGCCGGIFYNNTLMLEQAGWRGWMFDSNKDMVEHCRRTRRCPALEIDARVFDFASFLRQERAPKIIDYISFDVDSATEKAIRNFPFEDYEFLVMTVEHDLYRGDGAKKAISERLAAFPQYHILVNNVEAAPGKPFEDWIVNKHYFDQSILSQACDGKLWWEFIDSLEC